MRFSEKFLGEPQVLNFVLVFRMNRFEIIAKSLGSKIFRHIKKSFCLTNQNMFASVVVIFVIKLLCIQCRISDWDWSWCSLFLNRWCW